MPIDVKQTWKRFVGGLRSVFTDLPEHRHQDQFLAAREAALALAESEQMANEILAASANALEGPRDVVLLEMDTFPLAVSVHQAEVKAGSAKPGAKRTLCSAAKTILGSVGEVFSLTPYAKGVVAVLKEGVELFSSE